MGTELKWINETGPISYNTLVESLLFLFLERIESDLGFVKVTVQAKITFDKAITSSSNIYCFFSYTLSSIYVLIISFLVISFI